MVLMNRRVLNLTRQQKSFCFTQHRLPVCSANWLHYMQ